MLVLVAVSSINTSRTGSNMLSPPTAACAGDVRPLLFRRAQAPFFEGDIMPSKKPPDCGAAARNAPLAHRGDDLVQRQIRLLGDHSQQPFRALFQRRRA